MNYNPDIWYNELYRIFSDTSLLTVVQTIKLGSCLRALQSGENAVYHLNELYNSIKEHKQLASQLDEYIHCYINNQQEVNNNDKNRCETFNDYQFIGGF